MSRLDALKRRTERLVEIAQGRQLANLGTAGAIVGRIRRRQNGRWVESLEAERQARTKPWWRTGLVRFADQRFYVWREKVV